MQMSVPYKQFFEEMVEVAMRATKSPIAVGILIIPNAASVKEWAQDNRDIIWKVHDEIGAGLSKPALELMYGELLAKRDKDYQMCQAGFIEHGDIAHDILLEDMLTSVAYYDFLEAVGEVMGSIQLGRRLCRMTVCIFCEGGVAEARKAQVKVSAYIHGVLSKSNLTTTTIE